MKRLDYGGPNGWMHGNRAPWAARVSPARFSVTALMVLAAIVVLAS